VISDSSAVTTPPLQARNLESNGSHLWLTTGGVADLEEAWTFLDELYKNYDLENK